MRLLILGGPRFLGDHLLTAARARGHEVTLFHRGRHSTATADAETILGDRNADLAKLRGRTWDAAIDTCGYHPRAVRASAEALSAAVERYIFISSVSVYSDALDESAPLETLSAEELRQADAIDVTGTVSAATYGKLYGPLKALCERVAEEVLPGRVLSIRPGVIAGPRDYTDRLTYWAVRVARGGEVLAPEPPDRSVQLIDARDLSEWIVAMAEARATGIYNAAGPPVTMADLLESCRAASGSDASWTWVSEPFLLTERVTPWTELPLWLPAEASQRRPALTILSARKAVERGLRFRPLHDTIAATLQWFSEERRELRAGLTAEREWELLRSWHASTG
ncbi:MAG TPA: NAD-dependent epimerase/dehydratase family protein [Thermoanaerobaculia bacterium]|nr:NAD-dependent epimerase/dehydratase family protein [Thermoanaerobaculia bacterium]